MGTVKASDILGIGKSQRIDTIKIKFYIHSGDSQFCIKNNFNTEEEAKNLLNEWDKVEQYKAQVKQLREALDTAHRVIKAARFEYSILVSDTNLLQIEQALKDTE